MKDIYQCNNNLIELAPYLYQLLCHRGELCLLGQLVLPSLLELDDPVVLLLVVRPLRSQLDRCENVCQAFLRDWLAFCSLLQRGLLLFVTLPICRFSPFALPLLKAPSRLYAFCLFSLWPSLWCFFLLVIFNKPSSLLPSFFNLLL